MEKISGGYGVINVQVVTIGARMDEDLQKTEGTDEEKLKKEKNKNTGRIVVFRVKDANGNPVFLDANLRVYKTWEKYLSNNKSPQCIYCYPKDGFLRKQTTNAKGEKIFEANDVEFGEPPSCNLKRRIKGAIDKVIVVASPIIAITAFWCPASWILTTSVLSTASQSLLWYSLATHGYQLWDQIDHGEDYGASLMNFITSIGTMLVNKGLNKYLRGVALQNRQLTTLESIVITGFLLGMKGSQVASWIWMTWSLACKPKLEPMDIISYTVALHSLYSCVTSPWFAGQLLEQIRSSLTDEEKLTYERKQLDADERELQQLVDSKAASPAVAAMEKRIEERKGKIKQLVGEILPDPQDKPQKPLPNDVKKNSQEMPTETKNLKANEGILQELKDGAEIIITATTIVGGATDLTEKIKQLVGKFWPDPQDRSQEDPEPNSKEKRKLIEDEEGVKNDEDPDAGKNKNQKPEENLTTKQAKIQAALLNAVEKNSQEITTETENLKANERRLQELKASGENPHSIEEMERNIKAGNEKIRELESKILKDRNAFLDNKGNWMEDEKAREEYNKFIQFEQSDERRGNNTMIDQNGRIIKVVTYMNPELVFKMVSITGSTITFSNGETMDLLVNSQLDIHPRALDQMNRITKITNSDNETVERNDIKRMMELTRNYTKSTRDDFTGDYQAAMETYLKKIKPCLYNYQMITRPEINKTITHAKSLAQNGTLKNRLDQMTPAEAYRMRTVLTGTDKRILNLALRMATAYDNNSNEINTFKLVSWVEIAKMELGDFVKPSPPTNISERRLEYYEQLKLWEIEGLQAEGKMPDEAQQIANENNLKRVNVENGRRDGVTGKEMQKLALVNKVQKSYKKFHKQNFEDWNRGGSKEDYFFRSLENEMAFNRKMSDLRTEINNIAETSNTESLIFSDEVAAYYHVRKHGYESRKYFNPTGRDIPKAESDQQYLTNIKSYIFEDAHAREKFISQDGSRTTTIYDDGKGYWGAAKCRYDADLGREVGKPTVATHFPKIARDPAPRPASESGPTPDTKPAPAPAPPKR